MTKIFIVQDHYVEKVIKLFWQKMDAEEFIENNNKKYCSIIEMEIE